MRKLGMVLLLALLLLIIFGYAYVTDSERVRVMAEHYLSDVLGGQVRVGSASLSFFEGLRLNDVKVYVDAEDVGGSHEQADEALVFSAGSFVIAFDPSSMVRGTLDATYIVVEKPRRDADAGRGHAGMELCTFWARP